MGIVGCINLDNSSCGKTWLLNTVWGRESGGTSDLLFQILYRWPPRPPNVLPLLLTGKSVGSVLV